MLAVTVETTPLSLGLRRMLRRLRKERGWSQDQLGQLVGMDRTTLSKIENCRSRGLSLEKLERIAAVLGYQVEIRLTPLE